MCGAATNTITAAATSGKAVPFVSHPGRRPPADGAALHRTQPRPCRLGPACRGLALVECRRTSRRRTQPSSQPGAAPGTVVGTGQRRANRSRDRELARVLSSSPPFRRQGVARDGGPSPWTASKLAAARPAEKTGFGLNDNSRFPLCASIQRRHCQGIAINEPLASAVCKGHLSGKGSPRR